MGQERPRGVVKRVRRGSRRVERGRGDASVVDDGIVGW